MASFWSGSVVLITSSDPEKKKEGFCGTGFVIHHDQSAAFVLTCRHVVEDAGGSDTTEVDGHPVTLVAQGRGADDLAVLRVEGLTDKPSLRLRTCGKTGHPFIAFGSNLLSDNT